MLKKIISLQWSVTYLVTVLSQWLLLLLLFFSMRRWRFSSRLLASSTSWCWRHLWKFSTTTPTNMLRTKKLTMRRKEMKYSSIHGLLLVIGCRRRFGFGFMWKKEKKNIRDRKYISSLHYNTKLYLSTFYCLHSHTCWSTPTASRPWYIILTQPSLEARTNRDIRAWKTRQEKL